MLGKIYDDEVQMQKKAAEYALGAAYKSATDDIQFRYAQKSADVAEKAYEIDGRNRTTRSPKRSPKSTSDKAKLEWEAAILSAEKAKHDQALAKFEYHQKKAERDAADLAMKRRTILAPFDGEVVTIYRHQDEWVSPGDSILRLVRLDTMLVEGRSRARRLRSARNQRLRRDGRSRDGPRTQGASSPAGSPTSARWCG